jgi:GTP-binding protein EngB required for normal cell division
VFYFVTKEMSKEIFISFNVESMRPSVLKLAERLESSFQNLTIWICTNLPGGANFRSEIIRAVERCDCMIALMNMAWATSLECRDEFQQAVSLSLQPQRAGKPAIIPVAFEGLNWNDHEHIRGHSRTSQFIVHDGATLIEGNQERLLERLAASLDSLGYERRTACNEVSYIILCGKTGSGKSWLGNHLSSRRIFVEGGGVRSVTNALTRQASWNGRYIVVDSAGFFDSGGSDVEKIQNAEFIDFFRGKKIKAVILVLDRMDSFSQTVLRNFEPSGLSNNIIVVSNKNFSADFSSLQKYFHEENGKVYPLIYTDGRQTDFPLLKTSIEEMRHVLVTHLPAPIGLFKVVDGEFIFRGEEIVEEFFGTESHDEIREVYDSKQVPVTKTTLEWDGPTGPIIRKKKPVTNTVIETVYEKKNLVVKVVYKVSNQYSNEKIIGDEFCFTFDIQKYTTRILLTLRK